MKKTKLLIALNFLCFMLILNSCVSSRIVFEGENADLKAENAFPKNLYIPTEINWQSVTANDEISYYKFYNENMPVIFHCVKINLASKNICLTYTPDETIEPCDHYRKISTKSFAQKSNSTIAINFTQFANVQAFNFKFAGIHRINKINYSDPIEKYCALCFNTVYENETFYYEASIIENQTIEEINKYDFAFGGFFQVLKDGESQSFKRHSYDSRTGIGISKDGKTLFILVAEGNNSNQSIGISYQQSAEIFKALGAFNAMQADGGNSTDLCINEKSVLNQTFTVTQGSSLGFRTLF